MSNCRICDSEIEEPILVFCDGCKISHLENLLSHALSVLSNLNYSVKTCEWCKTWKRRDEWDGEEYHDMILCKECVKLLDSESDIADDV